MKLRHVLLLACAAGACGALLLAWDMHRRLKDAESALLLKGLDGASHPHGGALRGPPGLQSDEAALSLLAVHALGLLSLAFLFLAVFLLLLSALRERAFAFAIDGKPPPQTGPPPALAPSDSSQEPQTGEAPVVMSLSEAAQQDAPPASTD